VLAANQVVRTCLALLQVFDGVKGNVGIEYLVDFFYQQFAKPLLINVYIVNSVFAQV
jgi:hypothetical protein